jgi:predicted transcriptional regulator YdeE
MKPEFFENPADIVIMGIAVRTSPPSAAHDIPALWQRFMHEDVAARLQRRGDDSSIYAVYCDYESDHRGAYTMDLGVAVDAAAAVPSSMRRVRIAKGLYARFLAKGDPKRVVWQTWADINERWQKPGERRYLADFERYDPASMAVDAIEAEVVIGLG